MQNAFPDGLLPSGILRVIGMRISSLTSHFCPIANASHNAGKRLRVDLDMRFTTPFGTLGEMHG